MINMENPWKTLSSQQIYDNPWVSIRHETVTKPNGEVGIYGVAHFKKIAAAIVPLDTENNTWLVGQYRYTLNEYSWEIPMGGGDLEHNSLDAAQRELKEETGIIAAQWTDLGKIHTSNSVTDEVGFMYLAENLTFGEAEPDDTEVLITKKVSLAEAVDMVMNGKITDSISMVAILKVARLKGI
jgi:8-oxo-dGTP pyrophosphatase MutT (NUDIX family)